MTITDLVLVLFIFSLLAYAIYDQFIMPRRNGPTCLLSPCFPQQSRQRYLPWLGSYSYLQQHHQPRRTIYHMVIMCTGIDGVVSVLDPYAKIIFKQKGFSSPTSGLNITALKR